MKFLSSLLGLKQTKCDTAHESTAAEPHVINGTAFPEHIGKVPLSPQFDELFGYNQYIWGAEDVPENRKSGGRPIREESDNNFHRAVSSAYPWATDSRAFHLNEHTNSDRINTQYSNMIGDEVPIQGYNDKPKFSSNWEKLLAYHHGLYLPEMHGSANSEDDVRLKITNFSERVHLDSPNDSCKYLKIEEFRCLQTHQYEIDPYGASEKCCKWFNEWTQCMWDQEKFNQGYNFMEGRPSKKRRPYIGAPDFQYV